MPPTAEQLNQLLALAWELSQLVGKSCTEIGRALLSTRTLRLMGSSSNGLVTSNQAQAEIQLLEKWIRQAKGKKCLTQNNTTS